MLRHREYCEHFESQASWWNRLSLDRQSIDPAFTTRYLVLEKGTVVYPSSVKCLRISRYRSRPCTCYWQLNLAAGALVQRCQIELGLHLVCCQDRPTHSIVSFRISACVVTGHFSFAEIVLELCERGVCSFSYLAAWLLQLLCFLRPLRNHAGLSKHSARTLGLRFFALFKSWFSLRGRCCATDL